MIRRSMQQRYLREKHKRKLRESYSACEWGDDYVRVCDEEGHPVTNITVGDLFTYRGHEYEVTGLDEYTNSIIIAPSDDVSEESNYEVEDVAGMILEDVAGIILEDVVGTTKAYEMYLQRLERFKNDKEALEYDLKDLMRTKVLPKDEVEDLISKYKHRISKLQYSIKDSKIEKVPPELLLNASEWFEDKLYIERQYHVKIYNITSNEGLLVTGSRQDLEKLCKDYYLKDYGLKIVDRELKI